MRAAETFIIAAHRDAIGRLVSHGRRLTNRERALLTCAFTILGELPRPTKRAASRKKAKP